jgi:hypothetical protein
MSESGEIQPTQDNTVTADVRVRSDAVTAKIRGPTLVEMALKVKRK